MSRKKNTKPYWEMTTEELREATKEFDEEFVADRAKPMTPEMAARWERAKAKSPTAGDSQTEQVAAVRSIGGTDIVIPAIGDSGSLDLCTLVVQRRWPHAKFEDALTGEKYTRYDDIPLGRVRELFAYPDDRAEAAWDSDCPDPPPNSMLYLILSPGSVTVVLDDPITADMRAMLEAFKTMLETQDLNSYAEAA